MGDKTQIAWADATWNPITGCSKVSAGCTNCYAETFFPRAYGDRPFGEVVCHSDRLAVPLRWKRPRRIFVPSMGDLFHPDVPRGFLDDISRVMATCLRHTFIITTKRAERMQEVVGSVQPNIWLGVSVENQAAADERIPILMKTPAAVRWVSIEPLLSPVDLDRGGRSFLRPPVNLRGDQGERLDWVVVGSESGPRRRECKVEWANSIRTQCIGAGTPLFIKQLEINGKCERDINRFPEDLQIQEYPV